MSLAKFLQKIDDSPIGKFVDKKADVLRHTNPERIYVENVRSFYNMPFFLAKFFCELAVKEGVFIKKYGVVCPNSECERIIFSVNNTSEIPSTIHCDSCEALERDPHVFEKSKVKTVTYYKLNR